jgi:hypothetical protein
MSVEFVFKFVVVVVVVVVGATAGAGGGGELTSVVVVGDGPEPPDGGGLDELLGVYSATQSTSVDSGDVGHANPELHHVCCWICSDIG